MDPEEAASVKGGGPGEFLNITIEFLKEQSIFLMIVIWGNELDGVLSIMERRNMGA